MSQPVPFWRRRRTLVIALVASVVVNAFFLGAAATDLIRPNFHHHHGEPHIVQFQLRWLAGRLPEKGIDRVAAALHDVRGQAKAHLDKLRDLRQQLGELAAQPNPDRAAIDQHLADIRGQLDQMLAEVQKASMDALLALPADMRAGLAKREPDLPPAPQ